MVKLNKTTHHGMNDVITPKTTIVTDEYQIAVFRPNLSDIKPEAKEPRANPEITYKL